MSHMPMPGLLIKGGGHEYFNGTKWLTAILLRSTAGSSVADFKVFDEDGSETVVTSVDNINKVAAGSPGWSVAEGGTPTS